MQRYKMPFSDNFGIFDAFFGVLVGFLVSILWNRKLLSPSSKKCVPFATCNLFAVIKGMTGSEPYLYLYELSQMCKRKNYRLFLPILRLEKISVGKHFSFHLFLPKIRTVFVVGDVELARRILQDPLSDKPCEISSSFEGILKRPAIFTSKNSPYTKSIRTEAADRMRSVTQKYIDDWLNNNGRLWTLCAKDESFDPVDEVLAVIFYIICEAAFGYKATYPEFRTFTNNLDLTLQEFAYKQSANPLRKIFWPVIPGVWRARRASQFVRRFVENLIDTLQAATNNTTTTRESTNNNDDSSTFLRLLLDNPDLHDRRQQVSETIMFMAAGHETTGAMISNVMILVAKHKDVQDRLRKALLESKDKGMKIEETPYFKFVLLEASRIFPVAAMGSTRLTGRTFTPNDGSVIPAGSICLLPQHLCYKDPEIFKDPNSFRPHRWVKSTMAMENALNFTFSLGPRSCPGKPLAMEEVNQLLPHLLLRYSLHLESESQPDHSVILKHCNARLKVKRLDLSPDIEKDKVVSRFPCKAISAQTAGKATFGRRRSALFYSMSLFIAVVLFQCIHSMQTCPSFQGHASSSLKIAILTEPSPIGSYICGQSKRILFLMEHLVENTTDDVNLITAEVHDKERPTMWRRMKVHYTFGMKLPCYKKMSISFDWTLKALRELLIFAPDVIHVTTPGPLLFPAVIASRILGSTLVMSCHTHLTAYAKTYLPPGLDILAEWFLWKYTSIVHSFAHITLVTSPQIQGDFQRHGISRVEVWQKGVDSKQFHPDYYSADMRYQMTGGYPDRFLLVYIGRLAEEKRLVVLKGVLQKIPKATLCFIGAGPYENNLRKYFEGTSTIFLGELKGFALSQAFASGDVFCMPSTSETLGFTVLESMASGVPVVAAAAGGLQHSIENGKTGFLVTPDNEMAFVEKIKALKDKPSLRKSIVTAARREIEQWTWDSSMGKVRNDIYPRAMRNMQERECVKVA